MRLGIFWTLAALGLSPFWAVAQERSEPGRWLVQAAAYAVHYHDEFEHLPALGLQLGFGRHLQQIFEAVVKLSHVRPRQTFLWQGQSQNLETDWWGWHLALRAHWPRRRQARLHVYAEAQAGWLYLRPHTLTLRGGVHGPIQISPADEMRFSPALAGGLRYRCFAPVSLYLQMEIAAMKIAARQLNTPGSSRAWKPFYQLGSGLLMHF